MATYVYAPAGTGANPNSRWDATCGSGSRYCSGSCHGTNAGILPIDIPAAASSWIDFWCDPGVLSIRTISQPGNGCGTSPGSPWDDAVLLEMWSGPKVGSNPSGSLLGSVHFAHLATPFIGTLDTGWDANGILRGWSQWAVVPPVGTCSCPTCAIQDRMSTWLQSRPTRATTPAWRAAARRSSKARHGSTASRRWYRCRTEELGSHQLGAGLRCCWSRETPASPKLRGGDLLMGYPGPSRPRARPSPTTGRTRPRSGTPGRRCKRHIVEPMGGRPRSRDIPRRTAVPIAQDVTQGWRGNVWLLRAAGSGWCQFTQSNGGAVGPCGCRGCHPLGRVALAQRNLSTNGPCGREDHTA